MKRGISVTSVPRRVTAVEPWRFRAGSGKDRDAGRGRGNPRPIEKPLLNPNPPPRPAFQPSGKWVLRGVGGGGAVLYEAEKKRVLGRGLGQNPGEA